MKPTTQTKRSAKTLPFALTCYGLILIAITFQTLGAHCVLLSNNNVRQRILNGKDITSEDMASYETAQKRALHWLPGTEIMDELAATSLIKARQFPTEANNTLKEALVWQRSSLALAPANTYGWTRLAYLHLITEGPSPIAAAALALSLETGPYEPSIMLTRVTMAIAMLDIIDDDTRARLPPMIRAAWEHEPGQLTETARREKFISLVDDALQNDPAALAQFRNYLANTESASDVNQN